MGATLVLSAGLILTHASGSPSLPVGTSGRSHAPPADAGSPGPGAKPAAPPPAAAPTANPAALTLLAGVCRPAGAGNLQLGLTHDAHSLDKADPADVLAAGSAVLARTPTYQNQYLMGWGVGNPEPSPGTYDWGGLDARMAMIRKTGGTAVITLAGAPDWMKGGQAGQTNWSQLLQAPTPDHFDDFAALAAATARRYPQVTHFLVWSEMKGFWDAQTNSWDIQGYTALYNKVYTALKAVNPAIQVGGPYIVMTSWQNPKDAPTGISGAWGHFDSRVASAISYWLAHKVGADMIVVDGGSGNRDAAHPADALIADQKFGDLTRWLRSQTSLPIWWSEIYPSVPSNSVADDDAKAAATIGAYRALAAAGAATAWIWSPQEFPNFDFAGLWKGPGMSNPGRMSTLGSEWATLAAELAVVPQCAPATSSGG
jgi:hypothetical protein